jgi:hypothetical protein
MALLSVARLPIGSASATVRTAIAPLARELNEKIYRPQSTSKTQRAEASDRRAGAIDARAAGLIGPSAFQARSSRPRSWGRPRAAH